MALTGRAARERLERLLRGATMRMYVRISKVGNRKRVGEAAAGDRVLWSDEDQIAVGHRCSSEWEMIFDEAESRNHSDPDVSGFTTAWDRRRGLSAHYQDARNGEFQVLGFHFADRIGRNVRETIKAIDAFLELGVIIYIAEDDEFISREDFAAINRLHGQMVNSERFSIKLSERVRSAHLRRALSGLHHGGPAPAWLEWNPTSGRYEVVESIAELMRLMVDLRLQGWSEGKITKRLNEISRTKNGKLWRQCNVNRYLSVQFIEKMEGNSHFCVKGEEPIFIPNTWDPILDPEKAASLKLALVSVGKRTYFERHLENKAAGRTRAVGASARYLLTGMLYCSSCGGRLIAMSGCIDRDRYACAEIVSTHTKHSDIQAYFNRVSLESAVLAVLAVWLERPPPLPQAQPEPIRESSVDRQVKRLTAQIDELFELYQSGTWTKDDYLRKHQDLVDRRTELLRKRTEVGLPAADRTARELVERGEDRVARRQLIHLLVDRIEVPVYPPHSEGVDPRRPYVRVILRYPMQDGAQALLSPILRKRDSGPIQILPE